MTPSRHFPEAKNQGLEGGRAGLEEQGGEECTNLVSVWRVEGVHHGSR